jgi:hypothetical protein
LYDILFFFLSAFMIRFFFGGYTLLFARIPILQPSHHTFKLRLRFGHASQ